jgi:uncharacterized protein
MTLLRTFLALALASFLTFAGAQDFVPVPPLSAHVIDQVGMLNAKQRATLENVLTEYEQRTGSQIALLLMSSTAPEAIEQYSIRVADAWRLGRKGIDDGVILIVARDNPAALRRLRIEAGRGVQGTVTDAQSKRVLQDVIAPYFRQNDFYGGLTAGVAALTALLDQEHLPAPAASGAKGTQPSDAGSALESLLPLLFFGFLIVVSIVSRARGGRNALNHNGWGTAAGVILGSALGRRGGFGGDGGFGGGGFGGGGGGGFSGGGGGFDGGGASGNW